MDSTLLSCKAGASLQIHYILTTLYSEWIVRSILQSTGKLHLQSIVTVLFSVHFIANTVCE